MCDMQFLKIDQEQQFYTLVGNPEPEKKSVGIFEYILASMLIVYLDVLMK